MMNKKKLGQFFTNPLIARFMIKLGYNSNVKKVLDPATGAGIFIKCLNEVTKSCEKTVFELDKNIINVFKNNINDDSNIINSDYLKTDIFEKYDLIICNPPYNKFQEIENRKELIKEFERKYNIKMSGYSNYCVYFLIKSINELSSYGKCIYIIPYEFLNCGYGINIKKYLLDKKILSKIIKFDNKLKLFDDAITTSCIIVLENKEHSKVQFSTISSLDDLEKYTNDETKDSYLYDYSELDYNEKWNKYFKKDDYNIPFNNLVPFNSIAVVKRGIATGDNDYFSLNIEKIKKYQLSKSVCIPCICKSPDINCKIFNQKEFEKIKNSNKKIFIFNGENSCTDADYNYIKYGEEKLVNKKYLTSHRNPWYSLEKKLPAPIWISVFSREKLKVVRNELMIKNLTTFHGIYFKENNDEFINMFFCYLLTPISQKILYLNKREYGEGLDKFEPNDLNNALVLNLSVITDEDKKIILGIYKKLKKCTNENISTLNKIFEKYLIIN